MIGMIVHDDCLHNRVMSLIRFHRAGGPARYLIVSCDRLAILVVLVTGETLLWKEHDLDLISTQMLSLALRLYQAV